MRGKVTKPKLNVVDDSDEVVMVSFRISRAKRDELKMHILRHHLGSIQDYLEKLVDRELKGYTP